MMVVINRSTNIVYVFSENKWTGVNDNEIL